MAKKREMHENSLKNLKKFSKDYQPTPERKREAQLKSSAERKTMKAMLDYLLEKEITNNKGEKATTLEAMMLSVIKKAVAGDVKAAEFVRDTIGQKPINKEELTVGEDNLLEINVINRK